MKKYRFALMSFVFVALAAYALTPATQWGDVSPTNTLRGAIETTVTNVAFGRYVPIDGSVRMLGPLVTSYVSMGEGNYQATYDVNGIDYRFWGNLYRFKFPSMMDPGIGSDTNTSFATRYWVDGWMSNRIAAIDIPKVGLTNSTLTVNGVTTNLVTRRTNNAVDITAGNRYGEAGYSSVLVGGDGYATGSSAICLGGYSKANNYAVVAGGWCAAGTNSCAVVWNGDDDWRKYDYHGDKYYYDHGRGTFNINPVGGLAGFWIGETNMDDHIVAFAPKLAYNLYPVDVGGGTRRIEMPDAANTNNYVAFGWDVTISNDNTTCIGNMTKALGANSTAIGCNTEAQADNSIAIGAHTTVFGTQALAIGVQANAWGYGLAVGNATEAPGDGTAVGFQAKGTGPGTAIGAHAKATGVETVAIGHLAESTAEHAVQIGQGTNNSNNTFKVFNRMLLDADGHVPLLTGQTYDLSTTPGITNALADVIRALGGSVQ